MTPPGETLVKYREMFERRAGRGQCVNQPYLGCREFAAAFRLVPDLSAEPAPIAETRDLGFMLHDLDFANRADPVPRFFRAQMTNGVIDVPDFDVRRWALDVRCWMFRKAPCYPFTFTRSICAPS